MVSTIAVLVLLFSYRTSLGDSGGAAATADAQSSARIVTSSPAAPTTTSSGAAGDPPSSASAGSADAPATSAATGGTETVNGASEMTRYGAVQVQLTITDGTITDVTALEYPNRDPKDRQINARAIPELRNQVINAQSANVQGVSGATYTTEGYLASVQSALDVAGLGT